MVTPACVVALPTCTTTGTGPAARPAGICTFTCQTPATVLAAPPAYCKTAPLPAIVTLTCSTGWGSTGSTGTTPSLLGGFVWPPPVMYSDTNDPARAGCDGPFTEPSSLTAAAWPLPEK